MKSLRRYIFENLIIFESQESKSIDAAKKLVMDKFGWDMNRSDSFIRNDLRQRYPALRDVKTAKFILGVTRMFCDGELKNAGTIDDLNTTLLYLSNEDVIDKWDRNLNGKSAKEIIAEFKSQVDSGNETIRKEVKNQNIEGESDYDIVPINSFKDAQKYSKFTDWCITKDREDYDYCSKNGIYKFYFCLKNGFKNIERQRGDNSPLDEYGLSMLAVCVKPNGALARCTCRWNHKNGGNDIIMNEKEISKVVNRNFYDVFIPNRGFEKFAEFDFFEEVNYDPIIYRVDKNKRYNLCDADGNLLSDEWFDFVGEFCGDKFTTVVLNGKCNFISISGKILSDIWVDAVDSYFNGIAKVQLNGKWNFIDATGKPLFGRWFDSADSFDEEYPQARLKDRWYPIRSDGSICINGRWRKLTAEEEI